jgi:hypothetical protein
MRGSDKFLIGCTFAILACYLFYDSGGAGTVRSGVVVQSLRQLYGSSGSSTRNLMLLLCVPFLLGFLALLYDDRTRWAWSLVGVGGALLVIELVSRFNLLASWNIFHLLGLIAAAVPGASPPQLNALLTTAGTLAL